MAIERAEAGIAVLHQEGGAASRRIIVVVLEDIAIRGDRLLITIAEIMADDVHARAIGIHACSEPTDPHMTVIALLARDLGRMPAQFGVARVISAATAEGLTRTVSEHRPAIAGIPIPLAIGPHRDAVDGVVVALAVESGEDHLPLVDRGVKLPVAVDVGVDDHIRSHRNDHLVADDCHAHGRPERRFLHEHALLVGDAVPVRILQDDDAIAGRLTVVVAAVIHPFSDPDPPLRVEIEVRWVLEHRGRGPDGNFQVRIGQLQQAGGDGRLRGDDSSSQGKGQGKAILELHRQVVTTTVPEGPFLRQQDHPETNRPKKHTYWSPSDQPKARRP